MGAFLSYKEALAWRHDLYTLHATRVREYVRKEDLAILVVGKASDFDKPLSSFGTVTPIDITIPQPGGEKKAAATAVSPASKDAGDIRCWSWPLER